MSRASGSTVSTASSGGSVRFATTASSVSPSTLERSSLSVCVSTWPATGASGRFGMPSPTAVVPAWPTKPSQTREEDGTPAASATALTRNTAGVQEPQQPIPEIMASALSSLSRSGREAMISRSSSPCVEPKTS